MYIQVKFTVKLTVIMSHFLIWQAQDMDAAGPQAFNTFCAQFTVFWTQAHFWCKNLIFGTFGTRLSLNIKILAYLFLFFFIWAAKYCKMVKTREMCEECLKYLSPLKSVSG